MRRRSWPDALILVRHGESAGNVARDRAEAEGHPMIEIQERDMDVPLSEAGERQAEALGRWLADLEEGARPTVVLSSPYVRAIETARRAVKAGGLDLDVEVDERLREREFGILDRLTKAGIEERFPEQAEFRKFLGKFYHRPPGGESWADVAARVRAVIDELSLQFEGERVLVVSHQVVILMFRYVLERLDEQGILEIDREHELANCSITRYELSEDDRPTLAAFNETAAMEDENEPVTAEPDVAERQ